MVKWIFWLLLLVNVLFIAFIRWGDALLAENSSARPQTPLNAEKIILRAELPEATPNTAPSQISVPTTSQPVASPSVDISPIVSSLCLEWGEFSGSDLTRASTALEKLNLGNKVTQQQIEYEIGYWVYMPPRQSRSEVEKKISELKALGIDEFYVVQEPKKWSNAISLGIFKTEAAAQKYLENLREKGVRSALVGERASKLVFTVFVLKNLDPELADKLEELKNVFQGSELKTVACKKAM